MPDWYDTFDDSLWLPRDEPAAMQAKFIRRMLALRPGDSVLDCPCGNGRIAVELARAGCKVTGVDFKPQFIDEARRLFERQNLDGQFKVGDMREIDFDGLFDGAFNWSGSFGYFNDAVNLQVLGRLARSVRPGRRVLVEQANRLFVLANFKPIIEMDDLVISNRWNEADQRIESNWMLQRDGRLVENPLSVRLYTPEQFEELFHQAGLEVVEMRGEPGRGRLKRSSRRIVVVGVRPRGPGE